MSHTNSPPESPTLSNQPSPAPSHHLSTSLKIPRNLSDLSQSQKSSPISPTNPLSAQLPKKPSPFSSIQKLLRRSSSPILRMKSTAKRRVQDVSQEGFEGSESREGETQAVSGTIFASPSLASIVPSLRMSTLKGGSEVRQRILAEKLSARGAEVIDDDSLPRLDQPLHKIDSFRNTRMTTREYDDALSRLEQSMGLKAGELHKKKDPLLAAFDDEDDAVEPEGYFDLDATSIVEATDDDECTGSDSVRSPSTARRKHSRDEMTSLRSPVVNDRSEIEAREEVRDEHKVNPSIVDDQLFGDDNCLQQFESHTFADDHEGMHRERFSPRTINRVEISPPQNSKDSHHEMHSHNPSKHHPSESSPPQQPTERVVSHTKDLQDTMRLLINQKDSADVELVVGEKKTLIHAHSLILSIRSPVFQQILSQKDETNPNVSKYWNSERKMRLYRFNFSHLNHTAFMHFLTYMYTGSCTLRKSSVLSVLTLAREYKLEKLERSCLEFVNQHMMDSNDNVLLLMQHPELKNQPSFLRSAFNRLLTKENNASAFNSFTQEQMHTFFGSQNQLKMTPLERFQVIVQWGKTQMPSQELKAFVAPLLSHIEFSEIAPIDLVRCVRPENVIDDAVYVQALEKGILASKQVSEAPSTKRDQNA